MVPTTIQAGTGPHGATSRLNRPHVEFQRRIVHSSSRPPAGWLWAGGVALIVFAARCREIALYAGDVPYLDQWWVEAHQIIVPWLQGKLSWTDFFRSHHEHVPSWTRFLVWCQAAALGRWDPLLQCTFNAAIFAAASATWSCWLRRVLPLIPALLLTGLTVVLAALPHGWENSTWGLQSIVPVSLLLVMCHVIGSFESNPGTAKWWAAQIAGVGALFTFGTQWAGSAAVVLVAIWTSDRDRKRWIVPAIIAAVGIGMLLLARANQPHSGAFVLTAASPQQFIAAFLLQLGWPSQLPGIAVLAYSPTLLLCLYLRQKSDAQPVDRIAIALALHSIVQAAAFAYGRAGGYIGFVSRYGDLLSLGVLGNALALWRLMHGLRSWRPVLVLLGAGWVLVFDQGIQWISTRAHTEYFHGQAAIRSSLRRDAVKEYLTNHDATKLSSDPVKAILYPDPAVVTSVLDQPGMKELLPVSVRPNGPRARGDFISAIALYVRNTWPTVLTTGVVIFSIGVILTIFTPATAAGPVGGAFANIVSINILSGLTVVAGLGIFLWPMPLKFRGEQRWSQMLVPPGVVTDLKFLITTPTTYKVDNLTGGAALWPENFRNTFYGTHIDGPGFKGRAESSLFPINSPWLIIPYAGFPASEGNSIKLQIEDSGGHILAELICPGPNPSDIDFWGADVRPYSGKQAKLVFYDGRDDNEGWLAAVPPQPARDGGRADELRRSWALERTTLGHDSLGVIFVSLLGLTTLLSTGVYLSHRKISNRPTA